MAWNSFEVHLSDRAFIDMIVAAVEVYRKETYGILLGHRAGSGRFVVEHAIVYQTARRDSKQVKARPERERRVNECLEGLTYLELIGYFHSHSESRGYQADIVLSEDDIRTMEENQLEIVLAVNNRRKKVPWYRNKDGSISGTISNYFVKIAAWAKPESNAPPQRARIYCPYVSGFEKEE